MIPRSWLFVPGDSERKLAKAPDSGADALIVDLEDAVAPAHKAAAREVAGSWLRARHAKPGPQLWVRINPMSSRMLDEDLSAILPAKPAGILLPKPDSVADVRTLEAALEGTEIRIVAIATESALAVMTLTGYTRPPKRLVGLTWGAEDLAVSLGARANRDAQGEYLFTYRLARSLCQLTAAAAGVAALETVYTDIADLAGLERAARQACAEGFAGMLAIHPRQIAVINAAFTPDAAAIARARRVVAAFAAAGEAGVIQLDGRMLDQPHLVQARRVLERQPT
jgi:citrate lyase subunit beta/citryl-CoA lyase